MNKYLSFYGVIRLKEKLMNFLWGVVNRCNAKLWGVKLGSHVMFQGKNLWRVYPGSHIKIGDNCLFISARYANFVGIYTPCQISTLNSKANIEIGCNCGFSGSVIVASKNIKIGNNVRLGANTLVMDTDFHTDDFRTGQDKDVVIEDNVWLGYGVKVLKGVHIGKNSVIGLGSVVTQDIPANVIAAGNPCKVIRNI